MNEKKQKSPILVIATILFLAMFIALPPFFRVMYPIERESEESKGEKAHVLSCETISYAENMKIISKTVYEDNKAVKNTISYVSYTPTVEEIAENANSIVPAMTVAQAIAYFKTIDGVSVTESAEKTVVVITSEVVNENPDQVELSNYLLPSDAGIAHFTEQGFVCSKIEL